MNMNEILKEIVSNNIDAICTNNIAVSVLNLEVTLAGFVKNYDEKEKIEAIAWNTFGVNSVNNELAIESVL